MITKRTRTIIFALLIFFQLAYSGDRNKSKPNILFIFTDDQKWNTIGALGNPHIKTPNLDKLTEKAFIFNNAYCFGGNSGAVCIPSRNMLMSGKYFFRFEDDVRKITKKTGLKPRREVYTNPEWPSIPKSMKRAGYETFYREKSGSANSPYTRKQFDNYADIHMVNALRTGRPAKGIVDDALLFLHERDNDKPFFIYLGMPCPHDPRWSIKEFRDMYNPDSLPLPKNYLPVHPWDIGSMTVRDECLEAWPRSEKAIRRHLHDYYSVISSMDYDIGRLIKGLKKMGLNENTIIVFSSDQGLAMGDHGLMGKQNVYEGTMKVPMFITGTGIPKGESDALVYLHDIFPTLCNFANTPIPDDLDGISLNNIIYDNNGVRDNLILAYKDSQRSIRDRDWKLIHYPQINKTQLYNLKNDPYEIDNLAYNNKYENIKSEMFKLLESELKKAGDKLNLFPKKTIPSRFNYPTTPKKTYFPSGGKAPEAVPFLR